MTNETPETEEDRKESESSALSFFDSAYYFLDTRSSLEATFENAMRLAELMEFDFRTMMEYRAACLGYDSDGGDLDPRDDAPTPRFAFDPSASLYNPCTTFRSNSLYGLDDGYKNSTPAW
tara:strand:- start:16703 stop:17062 length:360 start_codon:yes stop_codon:yes gene_type:complete